MSEFEQNQTPLDDADLDAARQAAPAEPDPAAVPDDPVSVMQAERDEMQAKYLRALADMQNYARRAQQNVADARQQQVMDVARAMLTVLDHFDNALNLDPQTATAESVLRGVQMVRDELHATLERFGVRRIDARRGEEFDPNRHEALMHEPVEGLEPNHVATQYQPGYLIGDKTLRPAKVSVSQ